jgi:uncharacterized protein with GYD domain
VPKFLIEARYNTEGVRGIADQGGSARRDVVQKIFEAKGGKLEGFYFAFGRADAYVFGDLPDNETAVAIALAVNSDERVSARTTVLLTPEEVDSAAEQSVDYSGPGS